MQRSICLRWGEGAPSCQPPLRLPRGLSEPASPQTRFMASSGVVPPRKRTAWRARAHRGRRATPHENGQTQNSSRFSRNHVAHPLAFSCAFPYRNELPPVRFRPARRPRCSGRPRSRCCFQAASPQNQICRAIYGGIP